MEDHCKTKILEQIKKLVEKDKDLKGFLPEKNLDLFLQDIRDQKALWGGDVEGYKKFMSDRFKKIEGAKRIYQQKVAFNKLAVAEQNKFLALNKDTFKKMGPEKGFKEAFQAFTLGGSSKKLVGGLDGSSDRYNAIFQGLVAPLKRRLDGLGTLKRLEGGDKEFSLATAKELFNLQTEGATFASITGNKEAFESAKALKSALDGALEVKRSMGIDAIRRNKYIGPQFYSPEFVVQFKDHIAFKKYMQEGYNIDPLTFKGMSKKEIDDMFKNMYDGILGNSRDGIEGDAVGDEFITVIQTKDYFKKMMRGRKIEFVGAEDYMKLIDDMGNGNYIETIVRHLDGESRNLSVMSKFGTNPAKGHAGAFARMKKEFKKLHAGNPDAIAAIDRMDYTKTRFGIGGTAQAMFDYVSGKSFRPGVSMKAKVAQVALWLEATSKLGMSGISALGDLPRAVAMLSDLNGDGYLPNAGRFAKNLWDTLPGKNKKEIFNAVSTMTEHEIFSRGFSPEDAHGISFWAQRTQRFFHKVTGLEGVTRGVQDAMALSVNRDFARNSKHSFNDLPKWFRANYIDRYNGTEGAWRVLSTLSDQTSGLIDMDEIDNLKGFSRADIRDAKQLYFKTTTDAAKLASGEANSRMRFQMTAGKEIDDIGGAARMIVMQFKSFMFSQQHAIERSASANPEKSFALKQSGQMFTATLAGFYFAQQLKNLASGKDIDDPTDPQKMAAMMVRSGAATPYMELLLGPSRIDQSPTSATGELFAGSNFVEGAFKGTLGPASGLLYDGAEAFGKAMESQFAKAGKTVAFSALERVPFKNHFLLKQLVDEHIIDRAKEQLNTGFRARKRTREREGK